MMADEQFVHEITIEARHRAHDGTETVERVHAELSYPQADPRAAAEYVRNTSKAMAGGSLREIAADG
jgi:hypothetical protein